LPSLDATAKCCNSVILVSAAVVSARLANAEANEVASPAAVPIIALSPLFTSMMSEPSDALREAGGNATNGGRRKKARAVAFVQQGRAPGRGGPREGGKC